MVITLTVNGRPYQLDVDPRASLLHTLREELGLRGAKYGCGEGECGACTVLLNGRAITACLTLAGQAHGGEVTTVEGLVEDEIGAPILDAFARAGAVQCGFCTPGFVVAARALLAEARMPDTEAIQRGLSGNLCRCTGYSKIIQAVADAAPATRPVGSTVTSYAPPAIPADGAAAYARPATLDEALQLLSRRLVAWRVIAGGTDLLIRYEHRVKTLHLLDIGGLAELQGIRETAEGIRIGALAAYASIIRSPLTRMWAAPLIMAAREVGGVQIQNMGTLGGNLANASPAADSLPPLYVLGALMTLRSTRGQRTIPVQDIALGPGRAAIEPDELVTDILIPKQRHDGQEIAFFEKVGPRKAQTIAKASLAFRGWLTEGRLTHVRIALGAVAPTVVLAPKTAAILMAEQFEPDAVMRAGDVVQTECTPIDDIRSTAAYRRRLVRGLLIRNLWAHVPVKSEDQQR